MLLVLSAFLYFEIKFTEEPIAIFSACWSFRSETYFQIVVILKVGILMNCVIFVVSMKPHIQTQVTACEICGGQNGIRAGFLQVLWFPLPFLILSTSPYLLIILQSTLYSLDTDSVLNNKL